MKYIIFISLFVNCKLNAQQLLYVEYEWPRPSVDYWKNRFVMLIDSTKTYTVSKNIIKKKQKQFGAKFANHAEIVDYTLPTLSYQFISQPDNVLTTAIGNVKVDSLLLVTDTIKTILGIECKLAYYNNQQGEKCEVWYNDAFYSIGCPHGYFPNGLVLEMRTGTKHFIAKKIKMVEGQIVPFFTEKTVPLKHGNLFIKKREN